MSVPVAIPVPASPEPLYRLSVAQYEQMIAAGILTEDDNVELLDGWLVPKMTKNPPHTFSTQELRDRLPRVLPAGWFVSDQDPAVFDASVPEPDALVIRGTRRDYLIRHPTQADVTMIGEVADSSLQRDRGWKKRIYARARIPVYWIINLIDMQVEVYTDPTGPAEPPDYRDCQIYKPGDEMPVVIDGQEVGRLAVNDLLP